MKKPSSRPRHLRVLAAAVTAAAALICATESALAAPGAESLTSDAVDRYVRTYMEETDLPGAVVAVTRGDRIVHTAGYGHTAADKTLSARTPVPVASLSKSMTALAVMQLAEVGKVGLDRPVRQYLPDFTLADPRAERITVRQLLNQTSGMADATHPDLVGPQPRTLTEAVTALHGVRLASDPGTRMSYHNTNYAVAARLVEVVAGQPFATYMADRVFRPLGMARTITVDSTSAMPEQARGYVRAYGRLIERDQPHWFTAGGFGTVATADDLARWLIAQYDGGASADGHQVVSARSITTLHTPPRTPEGTSYAMGWTQETGEGPREIRHTGQLLTHNAAQILLPDSLTGIAVVTNTGMISGDDATLLAQGIADLARGDSPGSDVPFTLQADYVLAALTALSLALGTTGVVRARRWARLTATRPWWRTALRTLPHTLPIASFLFVGDLAGLLTRRGADLAMISYVWPALFLWLATSAAASAAVLAARAFRTVRAVRTVRARRVTSEVWEGSPGTA
ncbi:beta-lactamase family protein [Streptomyces sp. NBC_00237]|uniref:serine hydrolase domain-containing protein n=1 Tax=Streptomyces sp. NBC_00237 TaxID=2975687 RepID=UPI002257A58D|nr:serine hydrolase domain-containing protein [Streptomyces sp. NBC_00237]MCX5205596.1 beta-lactamase family protein [Streptomyces sp. NBC_00237]